ncbi:MAG: WYL domain-containing protein [Leptospiraceae bacterium]|nr:WYL domain-containing protein [Leptospiraceae bacterium]
MPTAEKLKRLLSLIPLIHAHPGIKIEKLMTLSGYSNRKRFTEDLDSLIMLGVPPFSPGDYVDITIEDDGVSVDFPQGLERPLALSPDEWSRLIAAIEENLSFRTSEGLDQEQLDGVLQKIGKSFIRFEKPPTAQSSRQTIEKALSANRQVRFRYPNRQGGNLEQRTVDPWAVVSEVGLIYLVGFDVDRQGSRHFRLDRAGEVSILEQSRSTSPPEDLQQLIEASYIKNPLESAEEAVVAFRSSVQKNLERILNLRDVSEFSGRPGWKEARCSIRDTAWFREVIRSFGETIQILSPDTLREELLEEVHNLQQRLQGFGKTGS